MPLALMKFLFMLLCSYPVKSTLGKGAAVAYKLSCNIYSQDASYKELMPGEQGRDSLTVTHLCRWER